MAPNTKEYNRAYSREWLECPGNRERQRATMRAWRARNKDTQKYKDAARRQNRKSAGIVDPPCERRNGPCEICGLDRALHLDHNHATGKIRGWLCIGCNTALGKVEKPGWFDNMQRYLREGQ